MVLFKYNIYCIHVHSCKKSAYLYDKSQIVFVQFIHVYSLYILHYYMKVIFTGTIMQFYQILNKCNNFWAN